MNRESREGHTLESGQAAVEEKRKRQATESSEPLRAKYGQGNMSNSLQIAVKMY
jgi:hypothetical protein